MFIHQTLLAATLLAPPDAQASEPEQDYLATVAEVEALDARINVGEAVRTELFDALSDLTRYAPDLADDPAAREVRTRAQLNLARSYLSSGEHDSANGIMDEVIRSTIGEDLPIAEFGPSLVKLHAERVAALEERGTAELEVVCRVPCRVYVNERLTAQKIDSLYLGLYRVWVEAEDQRRPGGAMIERVQLSDSAEPVKVVFAPAPEPVLDLQHDLPPPPPGPKRILPQGPEIALVILGAAALVAGGVATGLQTSTTGLAVGATMVAVGGAALVVGGITLGVDEVRLGGRRGRQAMLTWTMAF